MDNFSLTSCILCIWCEHALLTTVFPRPQGHAHTLKIFADKQLLEIFHVMMSFFCFKFFLMFLFEFSLQLC